MPRSPRHARLATTLAAGLSALLLAACSSPQRLDYRVPDQPEGASGYSEKPGWASERFAVAAANPLATDAGYQVLRAGGSALDAAIAVQMVLALAEPQSSGIGGGAFLLHAAGPKVQAYDGRETAPAAATERLFLDTAGQPMPFRDAVVGGRAVGVPGAVRMLEQAHKAHGKLAWATLFEPAIHLAEHGFKVSARLHALLSNEKHLAGDPAARAYFYDAAGAPWPVGHTLKNPELAGVLRAIARNGSKALLEGDVAQAIVDKVSAHPTNPGVLSLDDLARYQPRQREALCTDYQIGAQGLRLCGFPPPGSGAIAIAQILGILRNTDATAMALQDGPQGPEDPLGPLPTADWLYLYGEASRLAFADRAQYVADPDFVGPPAGSWMSLLEPAYLAERAKLIGPRGMPAAQPGAPGGARTAYAPMPQQPEYGTSHISVVDGRGNAVAMTTTIEDQFGARQMVKGFLLNNQLTDFSFAPRDASGRPIANRVEPGKRPRSSMSPTLVFDKATGQLLMSGGSPGGALIIHYTAKTLYGVFHWGLTPQQAINLPNFGTVGGPTLLEDKRFTSTTIESLRARGTGVREMEMPSGLQAITRADVHGKPMWLGGADPRREGVVMGD